MSNRTLVYRYDRMIDQMEQSSGPCAKTILLTTAIWSFREHRPLEPGEIFPRVARKKCSCHRGLGEQELYAMYYAIIVPEAKNEN